MAELSIFSQRLKEARSKLKLKQSDLAEKAGVTAATISSYESGANSKMPSLDKVIDIAKALNVSIDWLCGLNVHTENEKVHKEATISDILEAFALVFKSLDNISFNTTCRESDYGICCIGEITLHDSPITDFLEQLVAIANLIKNNDFPSDLEEQLIQALMDNYSNKYFINGRRLYSIEEYDQIEDDGELIPMPKNMPNSELPY